jgi:3-deoxy-manno-octulosonate cytidylyltransferase (CMP-KDO synthetase)
MKSIIVIPARYGSTRFPGKPLAEIAGYSMIRRVWSIASSVQNVDNVFVATDSNQIAAHVESFGGDTIITSESCRNGSERVYEAVKKLKLNPEIVVNLQGDAILTPPWIIQAVVDTMRDNPDIKLATPAVKLSWAKYERLIKSKADGQPGGTLVTFDKNYNALYFSKTVIPFLRHKEYSDPPVYAHIGLYGYQYETLKEFFSLEPGILETAEQLEQLRALENGISIKIVPVDYRNRSHWSVDSPDDIARVEEIISKEGELVELE